MSIKLIIDESVFNNKRKETLIETHGKTIGENLNDGFGQNPGLKKALLDEKDNFCPGILIKLNGRFVRSDRLTAEVKDGDTIEVLKYDG